MRDKKFPLSNKALPTFLCIGAMKSATTWLYEILRRHPEIYLNPHIKELNFFNRHYNRGIKWYERFGEKLEKEMLNSSVRTKYFFKYKDDIEELEKLFNIDLNIWKA